MTAKVNSELPSNQGLTKLNNPGVRIKAKNSESLFQKRLKQIEMLDGKTGFNEREQYIVDKLTIEQFTTEKDEDFSNAMENAMNEAFEKFV